MKSKVQSLILGVMDWGYDVPVSYYISDYQGNDEMIVIEFPSAGEWKFSLSNHAEYKDVELTVFAH